jgi:hypothetical protein
MAGFRVRTDRKWATAMSSGWCAGGSALGSVGYTDHLFPPEVAICTNSCKKKSFGEALGGGDTLADTTRVGSE